MGASTKPGDEQVTTQQILSLEMDSHFLNSS